MRSRDQRAGCSCTEGHYVVGGRMKFVSGHDCDYVRARQALIPIATRRAYGVTVDDRDPQWSIMFLTEMTALARERLGVAA